jgi:soluble lytic murein transglycosylase-like protein
MKNRYYLLVLSLCLGLASAALTATEQSTTVYKYIDENGVLHLTNKPPKKQTDVLYSRSYVIRSYTPPAIPTLTLPIEPQSSPSKARRATAYDDLIATVAAQNQLPAALLHAVVKVESSYNPNAVSPKGAVGLMQLMPATAERFGVTDATDPAANLSGGARYLRQLLVLFEYDLSLALAGYNAGENAVLKYKRQIPPYRETQAYVKKVMHLYQQYLMQTL